MPAPFRIPQWGDVAQTELRESSTAVILVIYCNITNLSKLSEVKQQSLHMFREAVCQKFRQGKAGVAYLCLNWEDLNGRRQGSSGNFFPTSLHLG